MAARTPASITPENMGSRNLIVARFGTDVTDADTWVSGIVGVKYFWAQVRGNPGTQTSAGFAATESGGTFTFYPATDSLAFDLFVCV